MAIRYVLSPSYDVEFCDRDYPWEGVAFDFKPTLWMSGMQAHEVGIFVVRERCGRVTPWVMGQSAKYGEEGEWCAWQMGVKARSPWSWQPRLVPVGERLKPPDQIHELLTRIVMGFRMCENRRWAQMARSSAFYPVEPHLMRGVLALERGEGSPFRGAAAIRAYLESGQGARAHAEV